MTAKVPKDTEKILPPRFDANAFKEALEAHDFKSLGIILSKYWWVENLRFHNKNKPHLVDPKDPVFQAILKVAEPVATEQWKVEWSEFTIMLYPSRGKVIFYATGKFIHNAGMDYIRFMTAKPTDAPKGAGVTLQEALDFAKKLEMFYSEEETNILGDTNKLLPQHQVRIAHIEEFPDDPSKHRLVDIFVDFSKGGELVIKGNPGMGGDLMMTFTDAEKAVASLAHMFDFTNKVGIFLNKFNEAAGEGFFKIAQVQNDILEELKRQARAQQQFTYDITIVEGELAQVAQVVNEINHKLDSQSAPVVQAIEKLGDKLVEAIERNTARNEEQHQITQDAIRQLDNNGELRATEQAIDQANQHDQQNLKIQIYGEGLLQQGRETQQKMDHHDLQEHIRWTTTIQGIQDLKQKVELYHKGVIFQTEFFMRRWQELNLQLKSLHLEIEGLYRIRDDMREIYAKILAILEQAPNLTAAQLAATFDVKPNKMHYWLGRLGAGTKGIKGLNLVGREKKEADVQAQQPELPDSKLSSGKSKIPPKRLARIRKVFHYFLRNLSKKSKIKTTKEVKPNGT